MVGRLALHSVSQHIMRNLDCVGWPEDVSTFANIKAQFVT